MRTWESACHGIYIWYGVRELRNSPLTWDPWAESHSSVKDFPSYMGSVSWESLNSSRISLLIWDPWTESCSICQGFHFLYGIHELIRVFIRDVSGFLPESFKSLRILTFPAPKSLLFVRKCHWLSHFARNRIFCRTYCHLKHLHFLLSDVRLDAAIYIYIYIYIYTHIHTHIYCDVFNLSPSSLCNRGRMVPWICSPLAIVALHGN
jgi:hypothetical protein